MTVATAATGGGDTGGGGETGGGETGGGEVGVGVGAEPKPTAKLVPSGVRPEVVSMTLPWLLIMLIWLTVAAALLLIDPGTPLIVAWAFVKVTVPKFASGSTPDPEDGASTIHSADDRCGLLMLFVTVKEWLPSAMLKVKLPWLLLYWTEALIVSPGWTVIVEMVTGAAGIHFVPRGIVGRAVAHVHFRAGLLDRRGVVAVDAHPGRGIGRA